MICAVLALRCAIAPPQPARGHEQRMFAMPGDDVVTSSADCPMRLEISGPMPPLVAGTKVTIPFVVRNVSKKSIQSCTIDGASIRIRSESDGLWRLVAIAGMTSDTDCSRRIRLDPGASESFAQEMAVFTNLAAGPATLDAIVGFDRDAFGKGACGEALSWRKTVTILPPAPK
jgi:hypothetical protein